MMIGCTASWNLWQQNWLIFKANSQGIYYILNLDMAILEYIIGISVIIDPIWQH